MIRDTETVKKKIMLNIPSAVHFRIVEEQLKRLKTDNKKTSLHDLIIETIELGFPARDSSE